MDKNINEQAPIVRVPVTRYVATRGSESTVDELSVEEPLEIRVKGKSISVTMRTPGYDDELAAGFLLSEGMIHGQADIARIDPCVRAADGNIINVFVSPEVKIDFASLTRHVFASSSCGLCGKASIDTVRMQFPAVESDVRVAVQTLLGLSETMRQSQAVFDRTGGLHAAALFDADGKLLILREDVGRHNAVDKTLGWALLNNRLPLSEAILLVSGRASFEIVQKALAAGIPIVASVSAPSSLAVELSQEGGQTLAGFLRDKRVNLYSHTQRIVFG